MVMRLGILGAGAIGEKHCEAAKSAKVEVIRIVDHSIDRASGLADKYCAEASEDPKSLWNDASIDAVVIGVPNKFHQPLAHDALLAGKDVLLEKPMALSAIECDELINVAHQQARILQIGYTHRYTAVGSGAKTYVKSGELGEVYHVKAHLHLRRGIPGLGGWFTTKEMSGGGALIDLGVHLIDLGLHLLGQPTTVSVSGKAYSKFGVKMEGYVYDSMWAGPPKYDGVFDVDDHTMAFITFDNGSTLDLQVAWACNMPDKTVPDSMIVILGDKGGISFELFGDHLQVQKETDGRIANTSMALPVADQMALQMIDFSKAVETRELGVGASPSEGRKVQAIVDAIYESNETNRPVLL